MNDVTYRISMALMYDLYLQTGGLDLTRDGEPCDLVFPEGTPFPAKSLSLEGITMELRPSQNGGNLIVPRLDASVSLPEGVRTASLIYPVEDGMLGSLCGAILHLSADLRPGAKPAWEEQMALHRVDFAEKMRGAGLNPVDKNIYLGLSASFR